MKKAEGSRQDLTDVVFSWSIDDILNENLYVNQVEKIPKTFDSLNHYVGSFTYPLLEETRAELSSKLESISTVPFAEVAELQCISREENSYLVKVDYWRNRCSNSGAKELYRTLPGDILILADGKPETASYLQISGKTWTFALVSKIPDDDGMNSSSTHFGVEVSEHLDWKTLLRKTVFAVFLVNITTNRRIWDSLHVPQNGDILENVLGTNSVEEEDCRVCSVQSEISLYQKLDSNIRDLNESQAKAVLKCLQTAQCWHCSTTQLIWGPPGTGKTKTLATLLFYLMKLKHRVLVCAPTNVAIVQVASRVLKLLREHNRDSGMEAPFSPLGELLLFENKERLKMDSNVEEIYLDYRVQRIAGCIAPQTGWRHAITSIIDILKDGHRQYQVFVENEVIKMREADIKKETDDSASMSFLEFFRRRYVSNAELLKSCLSIMCTHFSKIFISQSNIESFVSVLALLDSFEILLVGNGFDPANFEEAFAHKEVLKGSVSSSDPLSLLLLKRRECILSLVSLHNSLRKLSFPNALSQGSIVESCYAMARLIFCTASSSFKLNSIDMEPMELVVIDEAAQLKECESVIPLQLLGLRHAILVGDEMQLSSMVESRVSDRAGFGRSLFERLSDLGHSKHLLNVQYRMHPSISFFPNSTFYGNKIVDAPSTYSKRYLPGLMYGPYSFIDVADGREEGGDDGHSKMNLVEVAVVLKIVKKLYCAWRETDEKFTVGIISPYAAQATMIQQKLPEKCKQSGGFMVKVKSVDGFQGGEEDIIIVSTVRSNVSGSIGFLSNYKRMNVSITRARHCFWILGDSNTLIKSKSAWRDLVHDAKNRSCFFIASENEELAGAIFDVKKAYDQLDDLLSGSSMLFRNARWKVYFSEEFRKSFCNLSTLRIKMSVMNLLVRLSDGWRPKQKNVDIICESTSLTVKKFKVEGLYVLCTVDIKKEDRYLQVLKIWEVLPLEDIGKMVKRLDAIYKTYTHDYISRCNQKYLLGDLQIPYTWDASFDIVRHRSLCDVQAGSSNECTSDSNSYVENAKVSESLLLMKFYSLSSDTACYLLSDHDGRELDLPFEVTDQEREIILFPRSTFILGRSGTGKTTVLTMKLLRKEQLHDRAVRGLLEVDFGGSETSMTMENTSEANDHVLRQLFLTVSPKLSFAVKQHILKLRSFINHEKCTSKVSSLQMDEVDDVTHFEDTPDTFSDISPQSYPLVITFQKFLMMLDASVGISYFEGFSELRDLCHGKSQNSKSVSFQMWMRAKEVNFDKFCADYWPHFNDKMTRKLDPSRVFTEIMSTIKGGRQAGEISQQDYVSLSEGRVSTLMVDNRVKVYDVFLDYEKMKTERCEFDLADLVNDLHFRLHQQKFGGNMMDSVYVDEVQDLTMSQIALLKYICRNVEDGFVFSGDTAQTIARGIDFRFEDIRELFYTEFLSEASCSSNCKSKKGKVSEVFQLSQNFRTHSGILNMAQSVIDILYYFFPLFIDALSPETSFICGEAPIILEVGNNGNAIISIFDHDDSGGDFVGFGAEQVIIVRDDCARKEVLHYVKRKALVLTIVESKGLEFQDVLLYNFFGSSPLKNHWRILYEFMKQKELCDATVPSPSFDPAKHNILCSELKQLYVAITRTRQRLWISDNMEDSKPMFDYWQKLCLVHVRQIDETLAELMQQTSSPEEWKTQGLKLLQVGNYEMATMCFERAGYTYGEKLAKASGLRAEAKRLSFSNPELACGYHRQAAEIFESIDKAEAAAECYHIVKEYNKAGILFELIGKVEAAAECFLIVKEYNKAGALFESIGKAESAAECYFLTKDYERAGHIYLDRCGKSALDKAGECFNLAGRYGLAAEVYARGNNFSKCLGICAERELFRLGLQFMKEWSNRSAEDTQHIQNEDLKKIEQNFLENCASHYFRCKDTRSMMVYVKAFHSMDAIRGFLKRYGCLDELLCFEEETGHFSEAANIAEMKGDILLQVDLLCKQGHFKEAAMQILWYVLYYSLWAPESRGWPLKEFEKKEELIAKAMSLSVLVPRPFYEFVSIEASILSNKESSLAELNNHLTASRRHESLRGQMLSIRQILDVHLQCNISEIKFHDDLIFDLAERSEKWISKNQFSLESLMHFWTLWKDLIIQIIKSLEFLAKEEKINFRDCWKLCFNYLGVFRQNHDSQDFYLLLNPDASWVRNLSGKFCQKKGNSFYLEVHNYVMAAQRYWCSELISVAMKALDKLDALYKLYSGNHSAFVHIRVIIHIYEVAKFLLDFTFHSLSPQENRTLVRYIEISTENYFASIFPLDWRISLRECVISLRGKEISHRLLKERFEFVTSGKKSFGYLGRLAVTILGSSTLDYVSCHEIIRCYYGNLSWKALFDSFNQNLAAKYLHSSASKQGKAQVEFSLIWSLHRAVRDAYNANWRREHDYISPVCFVYLLERILISCCCLKQYFYIPKSSFVEWLVTNIGNAMHCTDSEGILPEGLDTVLDFVAYVVQQILVNNRDTMDWISKSKIDDKKYYPLLVLKLVLIMCILYVNFNKCSNFLFDMLSGHPISSWLPRDFLLSLQKAKHHNMLDMSLVILSQAFRKAGDPLVIVDLREKSPNLSCPDAIFVDTSLHQAKEEILKYLFPNIIDTSKQQTQCPDTEAENPDIYPLPLDFDTAATEDINGKVKIVMGLQRGLDAMQMFCSVKDVSNLGSAAPLIKSYLDKCLVSVKSSLIGYEDGGEVNILEESSVEDTWKQALGGLFDDLELLSKELETRESNLEDNISSIREISERLQARKSTIELALNKMLLGQDSSSLNEKLG